MGVDHSRLSKKKKSGGRRHAGKGKRKVNKGSLPTLTQIGVKKSKPKRMKGGSYKIKVLALEFANVLLKDGKCKKVKILKELENRADKNFPRRGILTKGAVIETEVGKAKITSRPSKYGIVSAVLV